MNRSYCTAELQTAEVQSWNDMIEYFKLQAQTLSSNVIFLQSIAES